MPFVTCTQGVGEKRDSVVVVLVVESIDKRGLTGARMVFCCVCVCVCFVGVYVHVGCVGVLCCVYIYIYCLLGDTFIVDYNI